MLLETGPVPPDLHSALQDKLSLSRCVGSVQELEGTGLDVAMAQHLLVAADRFCLARLRRICERRLCESVEVSLRLSNPKPYKP